MICKAHRHALPEDLYLRMKEANEGVDSMEWQAALEAAREYFA